MNWIPFFETYLIATGSARLPLEVAAALDDHQLNALADRMQMLPILGGKEHGATDQAIEYRENMRANG